MAHEKFKSLIVMFAVFACVGAISWAIVNSHAHANVSPKEQASHVVISCIGINHPETGLFTDLACGELPPCVQEQRFYIGNQYKL